MADQIKSNTYRQIVQMGLGEAIQRLLTVEFAYRQGIGILPERLLEERRLLLEAMNHLPVEIGFDCTGEGIPDDIQIFQRAAATSCCRIQLQGAAKVSQIDNLHAAPKDFGALHIAPVKKSSRAAKAPPVVKHDPVVEPATIKDAPVVAASPVADNTPASDPKPGKTEPKKAKGLFGLFGK